MTYDQRLDDEQAALRAGHRAMMRAALDDHLARLAWDRDRVAAAQRQGLRRLLSVALARSPFHAERLAGLHPDEVEVDDLAGLPVMRKADMMDGLDAVLTDRRLDRCAVEAHLAGTGERPRYLLDEHLVLASGGSSGERGVFVYDRRAAVDYVLGLVRPSIARLVAAVGGLPAEPVTMGLVAAGSAIHPSRALAETFSSDLLAVTSIPVTRPIDAIVAELNRLQPLVLQGYPSVLGVLAAEKVAGRLTIAPLAVTGSSEHFGAEAQARVGAAFGVPVADQYGSTEGLVGVSAPGDDVIEFASDLCIVELVDEDDRPVAPGTPSAKVLVTNLYNHTQPLIRYELTDRFVEVAHGGGHFRARVDGRADDLFVYGPRPRVVVHPNVIRSPLLERPAIVDYQARQTPAGLDIAAVAADALDTGATEDRLRTALAAAGLPDPDVHVHAVDAVPRHPATGKARRFVPLPT
jgi:phenylacetate-coenzyme A ligase PaaK-like adenylate-forming protein